MIIRHVHLPLISRDFLMTTVDSEPLVRENPDCKELMLEVSVAFHSIYLSVMCQSKFKTLTKLVLDVRDAAYMQKAGDSWDISPQFFLDFPQNFRLRTRSQYCTQAIA